MPRKLISRFVIKAMVMSALIFLILTMLRAAWLAEDSYITFRTVDNFLHGYGLTWNVGERVQAYTHPLWMFLISFCVSFSGEVYFTSIVLSLALSLLSCLLVGIYVGKAYGKAVVAFLLFAASKAFIDYTSSGLENPLLFFLYALFAIALLKLGKHRYSYLIACLCAGLSTATRLDTILVYLPPLFYVAYQSWWAGMGLRRHVKHLVYGFTPVLAWEVFSLIYYGFPFPNTAYAKLNTGISSFDYMHQGLRYFGDSWIADPVTLSVMGIVLLILIFAAFDASMNSLYKRLAAQAVGMVCYLAYVIHIGGDFMNGRFFALPYFIAIILVCQFPWKQSLYLTGALAVVLAYFNPQSPFYYRNNYFNQSFTSAGVADERGFYYQGTGLLTWHPGKSLPEHVWRRHGESLRSNPPEEPQVLGAIGIVGYYSGPHVHIVDTYALADPLLARLPIDLQYPWRVGHYYRAVPEGYLATLRTGQLSFKDPGLNAYYADLKRIINGPIWSWERFKSIVKMNRRDSARYDASIGQLY